MKKKVLYSTIVLLLFICCKDDITNCDNFEGSFINAERIDGLDCEILSGISDENLIINSLEELQSKINCNKDTIYDLDFSNYTLLVGNVELPWCCKPEYDQTVKVDCQNNTISYNIKIFEPEEYYAAVSTFTYYAIVPKIQANFKVVFKEEITLN